MGQKAHASDKRPQGLLIEICNLLGSKLGLEIRCILGEGPVVSRLSSRNIHVDNPVTMAKISLVNFHPYVK
jgi:hypothetical protein